MLAAFKVLQDSVVPSAVLPPPTGNTVGQVADSRTHHHRVKEKRNINPSDNTIANSDPIMAATLTCPSPLPRSASTMSMASTLSYVRSAAHTPSFDIKRSHRAKVNNFVLKNGRRHHAYGEKAPYPMGYDKDVIDLDAIDHTFLMQVRESVTFVNYKDGDIPTHVLDLGCGSGAWVLDAAKEWPQCEFVGFDLVNIQPPPHLLDNSLADRITWVHGNFLTCKLPFDDDEFDHVHIRSIARAVPENKWDLLFEEIHRVLRPGGAVEMIEEDIIFPTLPRWFTQALRLRANQTNPIHLPNGSSRNTPVSPARHTQVHDHALLELLYNSVFESRFVNLRPTAILPSYFSTYFRHVISGPPIHFPMPPLPPIPDPVPRGVPIPVLRIKPTSYSSRQSTSFSSSDSTFASSTSAPSEDTDEYSSQQRTPPTSIDDSGPSSPESNPASLPRKPVTPYYISPTGGPSTPASDSIPGQQLLPMSKLAQCGEYALSMHLRRTYEAVLACREAMWDELSDRIRNKPEMLRDLGWESDEEIAELQARSKFDRLIERYRGDMQVRTSVAYSLSSVLGWATPSRDPLSKAELIEEERLHHAMADARQYAAAEESQSPCRVVRAFVGYKGIC